MVKIMGQINLLMTLHIIQYNIHLYIHYNKYPFIVKLQLILNLHYKLTHKQNHLI